MLNIYTSIERSIAVKKIPRMTNMGNNILNKTCPKIAFRCIRILTVAPHM